jgi:hypothetical protein
MSKSPGWLRPILAVLAVLTVSAGLIAKFELIPTIACKIGLKTTECGDNETKLVELLVLSETGEPLANVTVEAKGSSGAPETVYSDTRGFVHINIPSKEDVDIFLKDKNYPIEKFTINLLNSESTTREIRLKHDGTPIVSNTITNHSNPLPVINPSPISNPVNILPDKISLMDNATWKLPVSDKPRTLVIKLQIGAEIYDVGAHATFALLDGKDGVGSCSVSTNMYKESNGNFKKNECATLYDIPPNKQVIFSASIIPSTAINPPSATSSSPSPSPSHTDIKVVGADILSIYAK